jgi:ferric-dicitrate binding protein FerR (iron transport regulator)
MSVPRYAQLAARLLRRTDSDHQPAGGDRERSLLTIERALAADRPPSRRGWSVGIAASVAAGAIGWLVARELGEPSRVQAPARLVSVVASPVREGASFLDSTGEVPLVTGARLLVGGRIATAARGGAHLELSTGTRLDLGALTTFTLQSQDALQRFALAQGGLDAKVAKLAPGERFVIDTPDAQVEVRGTEFHLEVMPTARGCRDGNRTRLEVTEGVVEVRASALLSRVVAGERWPSDCEPPASDASPASGGANRDAGAFGSPRSSAGASDLSKPPAPLRAVKAQPPPRSLIAEQNALFERGVQAQRQGDAEQALARYAELVARYPSSPLSENAAVARIRLLVISDATRARAEAASYLERYPLGFARPEAQRIVQGK